MTRARSHEALEAHRILDMAVAGFDDIAAPAIWWALCITGDAIGLQPEPQTITAIGGRDHEKSER
ncbi:MAG: hypothetical protein ABI574_04630 [Burkholderiales bacterium]